MMLDKAIKHVVALSVFLSWLVKEQAACIAKLKVGMALRASSGKPHPRNVKDMRFCMVSTIVVQMVLLRISAVLVVLMGAPFS